MHFFPLIYALRFIISYYDDIFSSLDSEKVRLSLYLFANHFTTPTAMNNSCNKMNFTLCIESLACYKSESRESQPNKGQCECIHYSLPSETLSWLEILKVSLPMVVLVVLKCCEFR